MRISSYTPSRKRQIVRFVDYCGIVSSVWTLLRVALFVRKMCVQLAPAVLRTRKESSWRVSALAFQREPLILFLFVPPGLSASPKRLSLANVVTANVQVV